MSATPIATGRSATGIGTGKLAVWWLLGSELVIFGWTGVGGGHYGFVVDGEGAEGDSPEYPIARVYPNDSYRLVGADFRDFLGFLIAEMTVRLEEDPDGHLGLTHDGLLMSDAVFRELV